MQHVFISPVMLIASLLGSSKLFANDSTDTSAYVAVPGDHKILARSPMGAVARFNRDVILPGRSDSLELFIRKHGEFYETIHSGGTSHTTSPGEHVSSCYLDYAPDPQKRVIKAETELKITKAEVHVVDSSLLGLDQACLEDGRRRNLQEKGDFFNLSLEHSSGFAARFSCIAFLLFAVSPDGTWSNPVPCLGEKLANDINVPDSTTGSPITFYADPAKLEVIIGGP